MRPIVLFGTATSALLRQGQSAGGRTASHTAFISYSHQGDRPLARALRSGLHAFAKPWYRMRQLSVFLDSASLPASAALGPALDRALAGAEWLLLLASPAAAQSRWVRQEVEWWLANRSVDRMLFVLSEGDINWDREAADFDWSRTTALPPECAGRFVDEPLYVDLRWARGASEPLTLRNERFRAAMLDIAAPLHGRPKDELDGEDVRQHRRTRWVARAAASVIACAIAVALWQGFEAARQRDAVLAALLRTHAERLEELEQLDPALLLAIQATTYADNADTYETLSRIARNRARVLHRASPKPEFSVISADGRRAAVIHHDRVHVLDLAGHEKPASFAMARAVGASFSTDAAQLALVTESGELHRMDLATGRAERVTLDTLPPPSGKRRLHLSQDGQWIAVAEGHTLKVLETFTGQLRYERRHDEPLAHAFPIGPNSAFVVLADGYFAVSSERGLLRLSTDRRSSPRRLSVGADGRWLAMRFADGREDVAIWNAETGESLSEGIGGRVKSAAMHPRGNQVALGLEDGSIVVRSYPKGHDIARMRFKYQTTTLTYSTDGAYLLALASDPSGSATVHRVDTAGWLPAGRAEIAPASTGIAGHMTLIADARGVRVAAGDSVLAFDDGMRRWSDVPLDLAGPTISGNWQRAAGLTQQGSQVWVGSAATDRGNATIDGCDRFAEPALSFDGTRLAVRCFAADQSLRVYDVRTASSPRLLVTMPDRSQQAPVFSPDGRWLISAGNRIDTQGWRERVKLFSGPHGGFTFSPDGKRLLVATRTSPRLIETDPSAAADRTWSPIDSGLFGAVAYSSDGQWIAAASHSGFVKLYGPDARPSTTLPVQEDGARLTEVTHLAFSDDSRWLVAVTDSRLDQTHRQRVMLRVFERAAGREIARARLPSVPAALSFIDKPLAVAALFGGPGLAEQRFPLEVAEWRALGCDRVGSELGDANWKRYVPDVRYRSACPVERTAALSERPGSQVQSPREEHAR